MAQLDPLLQALTEREAQELLLHDGKKPAFRFGDDLRPVSQKALTGAQITTLLAELSDRIQGTPPPGGQPTRFIYRHSGGREFVCEIEGDGSTLRARLSPRKPGEPKTLTAPPPVAEEAAEALHGARGREGGKEIDRYLERMVESGSSDLHLSTEVVPMIRQHGDMLPLPDAQPITSERMVALLDPIMPESNRREFRETHDTDFAYEIPGLSRFRVNVFTDRRGPGAVFRVIPTRILTPEDLGVPKAVVGLCHLSKGLVLVTGPTGSGKSTTLAALIDHINRLRRDHIITIEDPIEFVYPNRKCLINQREVHTHTSGFKKALRAALREDPDIVLVGEMRDLETIAIAIETAETGHLVFGTLHTTTACSTVDRIIDQFPADRQSQIRTMLASSLKGVVSQTLLKRIGGGRVAALEVLIVTPAISNLIREGKTFQIPSLMQTGKNLGMRLLNDALLDLVQKKLSTPEEAHLKAIDKDGFATMVRGAGFKLDPPSGE